MRFRVALSLLAARTETDLLSHVRVVHGVSAAHALIPFHRAEFRNGAHIGLDPNPPVLLALPDLMPGRATSDRIAMKVRDGEAALFVTKARDDAANFSVATRHAKTVPVVKAIVRAGLAPQDLARGVHASAARVRPDLDRQDPGPKVNVLAALVPQAHGSEDLVLAVTGPGVPVAVAHRAAQDRHADRRDPHAVLSRIQRSFFP